MVDGRIELAENLVQSLPIRNVAVFASLTEALSSCVFDLVWICTPSFTHLEIIREGLLNVEMNLQSTLY